MLTALRRIGDDDLWDAAEELQRAAVAGDPVRAALAQRGLGVGVVRGAEDGDEQLAADDLAGVRVDELRAVAGIVDEQLLSGAVHLAHDHGALLLPAPVVLAELRIAIPIGLPLDVLEVQQLQRHALLAQLDIKLRTVRRLPRLLARARVQAPLEFDVVEPFDVRPFQPLGARPADDLADHPGADPERAGDLAVAPSLAPLLPENLSNLVHAQSLSGHLLHLSSVAGWRRTAQRRFCFVLPATS